MIAAFISEVDAPLARNPGSAAERVAARPQFVNISENMEECSSRVNNYLPEWLIL